MHVHDKTTGSLVPCQHVPSQNHLLASLSSVGYSRLLPHLKMIQIRKNEVLSEQGKRSGIAYFPVDCVISIYQSLKNGESTKIAMIGNEGMFDITHILGTTGMHYLVVAETTGHVFVLDEHTLKHEFDHDETVQPLLLDQ